MLRKNYYKILGIDILSTLFDIKRAYKKLALKYHPDKTKQKETEESFKEINEAYHVLSEGGEREKYNKQFCNSHYSKEQFIQDEPIIHKIPITLDDIYFGAKKEFHFERKKYFNDGSFRREKKQYSILITRGMKDGTKFTFAKDGDIKPQHVPADIIFEIVEQPHKYFTRDGDNLHYSLKISCYDLISGKVDIYTPLINGKRLHIDLRKCVLNRYQYYILKGKGLPSPNGVYGDLIVHIDVLDLPSNVKSVYTKRGAFPFRFFFN
ncbi:hypothetical protein PVAND_013027 [Polypedilum vanderplanki]|uniref:J domain-containing protein n=1 Tax=Polypedilum vanderplanki TaxID=319348 RepID=A0A9J6CN85_POLVA|nr:hypothetical protein PVAND_013027 [Polypedilum vanderplanki]